MAKKRKESFSVFSSGESVVREGYVLISPQLRFEGSFDENFARLFCQYAEEKIFQFARHDLLRLLPKSDGTSSEEVSE